MTPAIFSMVAGSAACRAILGSPPSMRFVEFGEALQGSTTSPYAVWQLITGVPSNYLGQLPDSDDARVQVDVYASQQLQARALAIAIRDAIEPHAHMVNYAQRARDATTRNFGYLLDFEFLMNRD